MVLGLLTVNEVKALGLNLTVDKGTDESGDDLLGLGVLVDLACRRSISVFIAVWRAEKDREGWGTVAGLVLLVGLHGLVGSGTTDELVGELGLVGALGELLVSLSVLGVV